jgi:hypothetical protein
MYFSQLLVPKPTYTLLCTKNVISTIWVGRETVLSSCSPPLTAEVNAWSYTSIPPYVFMEWCVATYSIRLPGVILS